ncbi:MAG: hypothetical protein ACU85U_04480, partial [Gammaproteobacteria bacterium]
MGQQAVFMPDPELWDRFLTVLSKKFKNSARVRWAVIRTEHYLRADREKPFSARDATHVAAYLARFAARVFAAHGNGLRGLGAALSPLQSA